MSPSMPGDPVLRVTELRKAYGSLVAVDGVSFEVERGEIFGLIGPNGAGKTTSMECVEGVRKPDGGTISILGLDPQRDALSVQNRIGVQLQQAELQKRIKVWEAVDLWTALYPRAVDGDALLEQLGLEGKRNAWFMTLSGGQKQRLFIALALINDPELVFLDELTTGLDPQARQTIWKLVLAIKRRGKTVVLTTHSMEEAERLCDRVALIDHGRIVDTDTPAALVSRHAPERTVVLETEAGVDSAVFDNIAGLASVAGAEGIYRLEGRGDGFVSEVITCLAAHSLRVTEFRTEVPTLEDVFLKLTGHSIRE